MIHMTCDGCGADLPRRSLRYTVKIEVRAAYDKHEVHLIDLVRDHRRELLDLVRRMGEKNSDELEEQVYKALQLDLCPSCQQAYIRDPLHFHPEQGVPHAGVDIDGFLRSLGYGDS